MNLLFSRKEKIQSRRHEVKTFSGTGSRVIGPKFAGSSLEPFLCTKIVHAVFHSVGTRPDSQTIRIISVKNVLR